jgi:hypothetical protein
MEFTTDAGQYDAISLPVLDYNTIAVFLIVVLPLAAVLGFFVGSRRRKRLLEQDAAIDTVVVETTLGAILGILGLLLAFTFGNALSLSEARKAAIVGEAAALGTAFLRADYLPEPGRTELQTALFDYAKTRKLPEGGRLTTLEAVQAFLDTSLRAQARIWPLTLEWTADPFPAPLKTFVAGAVNDALDAHLYRMQSLSAPVVEATNKMLLASAVLALFLFGNRVGLLGRDLTWRTFVLSASLFVVMMTIVDTQRPGEGFIRIDDSTLDATVFDMQQALEGRS